MKRNKFIAFIFFLMTIGCTIQSSATVEPTTMIMPTGIVASPTPTASQPTNQPTPSLTAIPLPPTREMNPTPSAVPTTAETAETFLITLLDYLNNRDFVSLEGVMHPDFVVGIYPVATSRAQDNEVILNLQSRLLSEEPEIIWQEASDELTSSLTIDVLFGEDSPHVSVVQSSGWGLGKIGKGLLYIIEEEGKYYWAGLIVAYDNFETVPTLPTVPAPAGLIYQLENESSIYEWWRGSPGGQRLPLITSEQPLSINPSATLALTGNFNSRELTLFHLPGTESETISLDLTLMSVSNNIPWVNDNTAVLLVTESERVDQGTVGQLALLNTTSGLLTVLETEVSVWTQPSVGPGETIIFDHYGELLLWRDGQVQQINIASPGHETVSIISPKISPDGTKVAGVTSAPFGPHSWAYVVIDLDDPEFTVVHTFTPPGTDAVLPWGITWSPDGHWLALSPPSWDPLDDGVWLVSYDGSRKFYLGPGTGSPIWLDSQRIVYHAAINGQTGLQLYDIANDERAWLNTPIFDVDLFDGFWLDWSKKIEAVQFAPE
jgi:hypothetical protein